MGCSALGCKKATNLDSISSNNNLYQINLTLSEDLKTVSANQTVYFCNQTDNVLKTIKFQLYPKFFMEDNLDYVVDSTNLANAFPNGKNFATFNLNRTKIDNSDTTPTFSGVCNNILEINLTSSLLPDQKTEIYFEYDFVLPCMNHRFGFGENTINIANFYPVLCVFENGEFCCNPYNSNGDPFYSDMANYEVNFSYPSNLTVAHTGEKTSSRTLGDTLQDSYSAKMVRDFAIVASKKFETISKKAGKTQVNYFYTKDDNSDKSLSAGVDAINTFEKLFGEYPYPEFNIAQTDFVYGGMEYPNLVLISNQITDLDNYLNVIIHETAHQWWYGLVGNNEFEHPWLDESLTEFSTLLFYDNNTGYNLNHSEMIKGYTKNYTLFVDVYQQVFKELDTSMRAVDKYPTQPEYTYCIYVKGTLMWQSLFELVGEKKFVTSLKNYYNENRFKNATPTDLENCFSTYCKQDLSGFFSSWINGKVVIR